MMHYERRILDSEKDIYTYVFRVPCPPIRFRPDGISLRSRRWKPRVEFNGATYDGAYYDNVYKQAPRGPGMGPFYFARGEPEH